MSINIPELVLPHPTPNQASGATHIRLTYHPDENFILLEEGRIWRYNWFMPRCGEYYDLDDHEELRELIDWGNACWDRDEVALFIPEFTALVGPGYSVPLFWDTQEADTEPFDTTALNERLRRLEDEARA